MTEKTKGIFLPCWGNKTYIQWAFNLAYSIKHFSPDVHITLFHDEVIAQILPEDLHVFDAFIEMPHSIKYKDGKINQPFIKLSLYEFLPYDENIILDVDAACWQDIEPLFNELEKSEDYYYAPLYGTHKRSQGNDMVSNSWAYADDVWEQYQLEEDAELPSIQSSFQYVRKCDESKELYTQALKNLLNPIPLNKLRNQWGGQQPDELYMGIALAQKGLVPETREIVFFGKKIDPRPIKTLQACYYFLSIYGGKGFTSPAYTEYYDRYFGKELMRGKRMHKYKTVNLLNHKHANVRPTQERVAAKLDSILPTGIIPIHKTRLVDSSKLIRSYLSPDRRTDVKVTNWLNCSFLEFKGKTYFAYRMEAKPFCTKMKLGICLLDENLEPIPETNVLLELHSGLRGFQKGFHVEDPRLFIYNDELYLSYTDGYQMAQAKINHETLQATESHYINLPKVGRTEKNWTFFESDEKLYSVYDINSHSIFEMNGENYTPVFSSEFSHEWKWGELRGGTSPMLMGDYYIAFFHSALPVIYKGFTGRQYFMGAYTFEAKAPFTPIAISKAPILCGETVSDHIPRLSNKIFVVFPSGVIRKEDSYLVSFGYNDYECRIAEISDELLKENLVPIQLKELVV